MRTSLTLLAAAVLAIGTAPAFAQIPSGPAMHFTWQSCDDHAHDLAYSGQTRVKQVVSVSGLSGNPGSFYFVLSLGRYYGTNPAWACALGGPTPGQPGPVPGIVAATSSACAVVPGLTVNAFAGGPCVTPDGCLSAYQVFGSFPAGTNLDPAQTYAIAEIPYDLSVATTGACSGQSIAPPQCFGLIYSTLVPDPYFAQPEWLLSWNRPDGNADACAGVVPTRARSWGRIKTIYR